VGSPFTALVAAVETLIATVLLGVSPTVAPAVARVTFAFGYSVDHVADRRGHGRRVDAESGAGCPSVATGTN